MSKLIEFPLLILGITFAISFMIGQASSQLPSNPNLANSDQQLVSYQKQSNFIHEFSVPNIKEKGLKGIITDPNGNAWFYHQTNKTSTLIRFNPLNNTFAYFQIEGLTVVDNSVINLAGGQLIYDEKHNSIWFTDARLNALGNIDIQSGKIDLHKIPTNNSGIMGLALAPDGNSIWFTEIIGDSIGSFDINSKSIKEYPTGELTGPTLLAYDSNGLLWVTMSYSSSILKVEPWSLIPGSNINGILEIKLQEPDSFSPFGIAITNGSKLYISDHGSSRVIASNLSAELKNYTSYWTSPSVAYPVSLPSQVISDKNGNVYFVEHGGNKISKISSDGLLTEFDIPTGPLATVVYIAVTKEASRIWFTEWTTNRIGYLDNTIAVPMNLRIINAPESLNLEQMYPLEVAINRDRLANSSLFFSGVELSLIGMTESGLQGLTYMVNPKRINLTEPSSINGTFYLTVVGNGMSGKYTIMPKLIAFEKDNLTVSFSRPQNVIFDTSGQQIQSNIPSESNLSNPNQTAVLLRDIARYGSIAVAMMLIGYLVYRKIIRRKFIHK